MGFKKVCVCGWKERVFFHAPRNPPCPRRDKEREDLSSLDEQREKFR